MKRKIVLWGSNDQDEKLLVALELLDSEGKVNIYTFKEDVATEAFYNDMLNGWRDGKELELPTHELIERPLNMSDNILPDEIKVDRPDIITRAQTEWHFVVLSAKLFDMYRSELDDLKDTVDNLSKFDNKVWNEMKAFWGKVQEQVIEKNLFREHASTLKTKTNNLFDKLKKLKKELDKEFEEASKKTKAAFEEELGQLEDKIEKGLGLKPIFEDLKQMQNRFKGAKMTRKDKDDIWSRIDQAFKVVKEKRFGDKKGGDGSALSRLERRFEGLLNAISKMERSIKRDRDDMAFQNKKIASTDGQLEMQIRQAKLKMIEERIRSKDEKLQDMLKTKDSLEKKISSEKAKAEKQKMMEAAKEVAKEKIEAEKEKAAAAVEAASDKLEEAVAKVKSNKKSKKDDSEAATASDENPNAQREDSIAEALTETIGEAFEDMVDTVKAVADVMEDKIEDAIDRLKGEEE